MIGTRFAQFEIVSHLGTGGMGEVYRAMDSKLGRSVAIKLLPEAFSHDGDRVARFEREARVLASLNHPNIAAIHGIEESGGRRFLIMELVVGETLAERIQRGPIPVDEAIDYGKQIADGLESAHAKGIVHRDLKPANVMITAQGHVKLLDFGLARRSETTCRDRSIHCPDGWVPKQARDDSGHGRVHVARAGAGQAGRRTLGHLLIWRGVVRVAERQAPIHRRIDGRSAERGAARRSGAIERSGTSRGHRAPVHGQTPGGPVWIDDGFESPPCNRVATKPPTRKSRRSRCCPSPT